MVSPRSTTFLLITFALSLPGCQANDSTPEGAEAASSFIDADAATANIVEVTGLDFAYDAPMEISPGWTTFRFSSQGAEPHHLTLMRLENGHSLADLMSALQERRPLAGIATALGGPNAPMPGGVSTATMHLEEGEYAMLCFIPSADGSMHLMKGMVRSVSVRGPAAGSAPAEDARLTFSDYSFDISGDLTAGQRTIMASTHPDATEPHEVLLARLAPGATAQDLDDWIHSMKGPPPAEFLGGVTALDPGKSATFTADLTPGEYAFLCPLPSVKDGEAHSRKGMIHQFTVR